MQVRELQSLEGAEGGLPTQATHLPPWLEPLSSLQEQVRGRQLELQGLGASQEMQGWGTGKRPLHFYLYCSLWVRTSSLPLARIHAALVLGLPHPSVGTENMSPTLPPSHPDPSWVPDPLACLGVLTASQALRPEQPTAQPQQDA